MPLICPNAIYLPEADPETLRIGLTFYDIVRTNDRRKMVPHSSRFQYILDLVASGHTDDAEFELNCHLFDKILDTVK